MQSTQQKQFLLSIALKSTPNCSKWLAEPKADGRLRDPLKIQESLEASKLKLQETAKDYVFSGTLAMALLYDRETKSLDVFDKLDTFMARIGELSNVRVEFCYTNGQFLPYGEDFDVSPTFFGLGLFNSLRVVAMAEAAAKSQQPRLQFVVPGGTKLFDPSTFFKHAITADELIERQPFTPGFLDIKSGDITNELSKDLTFQRLIKELVYVKQCLEFLGI